MELVLSGDPTLYGKDTDLLEKRGSENFPDIAVSCQKPKKKKKKN